MPTSGRGGRSASTATSRCSRRLAATAHVVEPPAARLAILNCTICSVSVNRVKWRCCRPCVRYVNKPVEALGVSACCRVVPGGRAVGHRWHPNLARVSYRAVQRQQLHPCTRWLPSDAPHRALTRLPATSCTSGRRAAAATGARVGGRAAALGWRLAIAAAAAWRRPSRTQTAFALAVQARPSAAGQLEPWKHIHTHVSEPASRCLPATPGLSASVSTAAGRRWPRLCV